MQDINACPTSYDEPTLTMDFIHRLDPKRYKEIRNTYYQTCMLHQDQDPGQTYPLKMEEALIQIEILRVTKAATQSQKILYTAGPNGPRSARYPQYYDKEQPTNNSYQHKDLREQFSNMSTNSPPPKQKPPSPCKRCGGDHWLSDFPFTKKHQHK
jgi:hypothetical protein